MENSGLNAVGQNPIIPVNLLRLWPSRFVCLGSPEKNPCLPTVQTGSNPWGLKDKKHEKMVAKMSKWVEEGDVDPLMLGEWLDLDFFLKYSCWKGFPFLFSTCEDLRDVGCQTPMEPRTTVDVYAKQTAATGQSWFLYVSTCFYI